MIRTTIDRLVTSVIAAHLTFFSLLNTTRAANTKAPMYHDFASKYFKDNNGWVEKTDETIIHPNHINSNWSRGCFQASIVNDRGLISSNAAKTKLTNHIRNSSGISVPSSGESWYSIERGSVNNKSRKANSLYCHPK